MGGVVRSRSVASAVAQSARTTPLSFSIRAFFSLNYYSVLEGKSLSIYGFQLACHPVRYELQTFVSKKNKVWIWTVVDHFRPGILGWVLGNRSAETFIWLWQALACWQCYFWVSDGNPVYKVFIPESDQIISKTYMTRVEGENTRLRHYARSTAPQNIVLLQICRDAEAFHQTFNSLS